MPIKFFTDEDVYGSVAPALRRAGFDAVSSPEANRLGATDEEQLEWASRESRTIVTFNVAHFVRLQSEWVSGEKHHAGIIVSVQRPIGDLLRRLLNLGNSVSVDEMGDCLEYLNRW